MRAFAWKAWIAGPVLLLASCSATERPRQLPAPVSRAPTVTLPAVTPDRPPALKPRSAEETHSGSMGEAGGETSSERRTDSVADTVPDAAGADLLRLPTLATIGLRTDAWPADEVDPERALVSTAKVTHVYSRPSFKSRKLGYLRAGAVVRRSAEPAGHAGCTRGFYEIGPEGFVCVGSTASLDTGHDLAKAVTRRADRTAALPYPYGSVPLGGAPLYTRIPSPEEQRQVEQDLHWHLRHKRGSSFTAFTFDEVPWFLQDGAPAISVHGYRHPRSELYKRMAIPNSGFAFISLFEAAGRSWGLTVDMMILPLDRLRPIEPSEFHGIPLVGVSLPVVFNRAKDAYLYEGHPRTTGLTIARKLGYREAVPITGEVLRVGDRRYYTTRSGQYLVDRRLVRIDPMKVVPKWATPGRSWIDVSILKQSLVAYEGTTPIFATLVSTGIDGIQDPETTHSTLQGQFLVHTKHVTATMSSNEVGDEFDLRDVPYVQYFSADYALHAAYWHDAFGTPRSHGCINLAPRDARWLFGWTDPPVPSDWHGAMSLRDGTLISIHP